MSVISFVEYTPMPRFDGIPWTQARIEEAASADGPWTPIDSKVLAPVDADPKQPLSRDLTTENATLLDGWYRIVFIDQTGDEQQPTQPVHNISVDLPFLPTVRDVADLLRARTKDNVGVEVGDFTANTRPTSGAVADLIQQAAADVIDAVDTDIPAETWPTASALIALGTAMRVELSYFPEQVGTANSPYDRYKDLYDEMLPRLVSAVEREAQEEITGEEPMINVAYRFPVGIDWDRVLW